jgi:hypothetical protein
MRSLNGIDRAVFFSIPQIYNKFKTREMAISVKNGGFVKSTFSGDVASFM